MPPEAGHSPFRPGSPQQKGPPQGGFPPHGRSCSAGRGQGPARTQKGSRRERKALSSSGHGEKPARGPWARPCFSSVPDWDKVTFSNYQLPWIFCPSGYHSPFPLSSPGAGQFLSENYHSKENKRKREDNREFGRMRAGPPGAFFRLSGPKPLQNRPGAPLCPKAPYGTLISQPAHKSPPPRAGPLLEARPRRRPPDKKGNKRNEQRLQLRRPRRR